jgi:hypothetical protein
MTTPTLGVSTLNTPDVRDVLQYAAAVHDLQLIDQLTDRLAAEGVVRKRSDTSQLALLRDQCTRVRAA